MALKLRICTFALLSLVAVSVQAQTAKPAKPSPNGGTVTGTVKDATGAVIPGATVTLTGDDGKTQQAQTGADGVYTFRGVAPGTYSVSTVFKGLEQTGGVAVAVSTGQVARGDVSMKLAEVKQEVTVAEENTSQLGLQASQNVDALVFKGADLQALPDDPDDLQQDLQALAGPSAGPNGGEIYIDGFSSGRLPPKESIREIRINQNPFSSEYDKLGFGRIEIFTKPGSDKFHGTASYDISDGVWNARNPFLTIYAVSRIQVADLRRQRQRSDQQARQLFPGCRKAADRRQRHSECHDYRPDYVSAGNRPRRDSHSAAAHHLQPAHGLGTERQ